MSSLDAILRPRTVAVVGASRRPGSIGHRIVGNLLLHGYTGGVYPVNPGAAAVHGVPAWPRVRDIPGPVDLAVVVVPRDRVLEVVDDCGEKGVPGLVVISAGFREVGGAGVERELHLMERVRRYGMRLVGPNCMGVLTTDPEFSMNATFAPTMPPEGPVSFLSQSGAMGVTILDYAVEYGIGIRDFVSVGNKPDVSGNDLLEYWEEDPATKVILLYLENFGNPRRFTRIARRVSRRKPIVVVKSGRSVAGARAASSHTGALAGADAAADALLARCGVLRADTVEQLFDLAMAFSGLPLPGGNRVAIITNAGGPGIIIADACEGAGLEVPPLARDTVAALERVFPEEASLGNPVDMIATATPESYRMALTAVLADPGVDAAIAAFVPPVGIQQEEVARAIVEGAGSPPSKPVLAVLMGREGLDRGRAVLRKAGIPGYIFPESAARALSALHRYARWLEKPVDDTVPSGLDRRRVSEVIERVRGAGRTELNEAEGLDVLSAAGIPTVPYRVVSTPEDAVRAAREMGGPVVLKVLASGLAHKSDVGGVRVGVEGDTAVREAAAGILTAVGSALPGLAIEGLLVQPLVRGGREMILGMSLDPSFGPLLMFGLGGVLVEALRDVVFGVHPVGRAEALEMVTGIRGRALLEGFRGEPPVDVHCLAEAVQRISMLVGAFDDIVELDVNPFLAMPEGGLAVDARIRLLEPPDTSD